MDINYRFSNLIGSVYRNGDLIFSPDGNSIISPVGNKISIFDLKNNVSRTLSIESEYNIVSMTANQSGSHLIVTNEVGHVMYVNINSETVLHTFRANRVVKAIQFSPDGNHVAICRGMDLQIHELATVRSSVFYPFSLQRTYKMSSESLNSVDWSHDGCLVVAGGEDKVVRVVGSKSYKNLYIHAMSAHKGALIGTQFLHDSYDFITVCRRGMANLWTCSLVKGDLIEGEWIKPDDDVMEVDDEKTVNRMFYEKTSKFSLCESSGTGKSTDVTACRLHPKSNILVTAFATGVFVLHELPTFSLVHNLSVSDLQIHTLSINATGDWIALGCGKGSAAQLVVWEWQSETYVMKQQAHAQRIRSSQFSPDGSLIATGAEDGKVKIWNGRSGFCTVTFDEHTSVVSDVCWTQNGKAILSASYDGTVRAHDLKRYRNFRTLACPEPTQLSALAVDKVGDIVVACGKDVYNLFVWSMESGNLLDILSGHQSCISGISMHGNKVATAAWDRTVRVWNIVDSTSEAIDLAQEGLDVIFSPCGQIIAVLTTDSEITFYHAEDMSNIGSIEAKFDLDPGRSQVDTITKESSAKSKSFTSIAFSPDGAFLLAGGESNNFCLYSVADKLLVKKFTITENKSYDGVMLDVYRRNFSEFGNMALVDTSDDEVEADNKKAISLPGSRHADLGERKTMPQIAVYAVTYCPTGRRFAVCSTEGVAVYSLDTISLFDPFQLDSSTSPEAVKKHLKQGDYSTAIMASLRLQESELIQKCMERTPIIQIPLVIRSIPVQFAERLLKWMSEGEVVWSSPHVHFYMIWLKELLHTHGLKLKGRADVAVLTGVQQIVAHQQQLISNLADQNKYSLRFLRTARKLKRKELNKEDMEEG